LTAPCLVVASDGRASASARVRRLCYCPPEQELKNAQFYYSDQSRRKGLRGITRRAAVGRSAAASRSGRVQCHGVLPRNYGAATRPNFRRGLSLPCLPRAAALGPEDLARQLLLSRCWAGGRDRGAHSRKRMCGMIRRRRKLGSGPGSHASPMETSCLQPTVEQRLAGSGGVGVKTLTFLPPGRCAQLPGFVPPPPLWTSPVTSVSVEGCDDGRGRAVGGGTGSRQTVSTMSPQPGSI